MSDNPQLLVNIPSNLYTASRALKALANGKIYVGIPDADPSIPGNQITVYMVNEDGSRVPIQQPVIINAGGHPVYNGQVINQRSWKASDLFRILFMMRMVVESITFLALLGTIRKI